MSTLPMAESPSTHEAQPMPGQAHAAFAVCLPSMSSEMLRSMVQRLQRVLPAEPLLIASPDQAEEEAVGEGPMHLVPYPVQRTESEWVLNAADYAAAARLAQERDLHGVLLLGTEAGTLQAQALLGLRQSVGSGIDLVVPRYRTGPQEGLVNSALLYPLTRALFGADVRFPLPLDAAMSARMLTRLASAATRSGAPQEGGLVWPVAEASIAGYSVRQVEAVERSLPHPQENDLHVLFPAVTSSLFADVESKATYWQRARTLAAGRTAATTPRHHPTDPEEIRSLVEGFRLAFSNLREIWSLVLPPQSLLSLKKLSLTPPESFTLPPSLWARLVYDFALAFRLRTLNRGHLLGAMTRLYLAWVAGFLHEAGTGAGSDAFLESTAAAFEQEKPYLVSRWRWPDRFNP